MLSESSLVYWSCVPTFLWVWRNNKIRKKLHSHTKGPKRSTPHTPRTLWIGTSSDFDGKDTSFFCRWLSNKCLMYSYNTTSEPIYQWFDVNNYRWESTVIPKTLKPAFHCQRNGLHKGPVSTNGPIELGQNIIRALLLVKFTIPAPFCWSILIELYLGCWKRLNQFPSNNVEK